jgi:hypothetical protein
LCVEEEDDDDYPSVKERSVLVTLMVADAFSKGRERRRVKFENCHVATF